MSFSVTVSQQWPWPEMVWLHHKAPDFSLTATKLAEERDIILYETDLTFLFQGRLWSEIDRFHFHPSLTPGCPESFAGTILYHAVQVRAEMEPRFIEASRLPPEWFRLDCPERLYLAMVGFFLEAREGWRPTSEQNSTEITPLIQGLGN